MSATAPPRPNPRPAQPVSSIDLAWLRMDEPGNLMQINGVFVLGEPVPFDRVRAMIGRRLLPIPRFRQRIVRHGGRAVWEDDPHFDLDRHLLREVLPAGSGDAELRQRIDALMAEPLDPTRPLWCFHWIEGYGRGAALVTRLHHCIGDGMGLLMVMLAMCDRQPVPDSDPENPNPFLQLFEGGADIERIRAEAHELMPDGMRLLSVATDAMRDRRRRWLTRLATPGALLRLTFRKSDPRTPLKGRLAPEKRVAWSESIPFEQIRALGKAMGATVNDVLVAAMSGGIGRYLAGRGRPPAGIDVRAAMPVNLRPFEQLAQLGNRFGLMFLSLPVGIADPGARLVELRRRAAALKRSAEPFAAYVVLNALGAIPLWAQQIIVRIFGTKATCVFTNVPGPRERLYFCGRPVDDIFFWVPQSGHLAMGISILSYAGRVRLGVATDAGLIPDPQRIVDGFHAELAAMTATAGIPAAAPQAAAG